MSILDHFALKQTAVFEKKSVTRDSVGRPVTTWINEGSKPCRMWLGVPSEVFKSDRFTGNVSATLAMRPSGGESKFDISYGSRVTVDGTKYGVIGVDDVASEGEVVLVYLQEAGSPGAGSPGAG